MTYKKDGRTERCENCLEPLWKASFSCKGCISNKASINKQSSDKGGGEFDWARYDEEGSGARSRS